MYHRVGNIRKQAEVKADQNSLDLKDHKQKTYHAMQNMYEEILGKQD